MNGLRCHVMKSHYGSCSNGGLSTYHDVLWLADPRDPDWGVPIPQEDIDKGMVVYVSAIGDQYERREWVHAAAPKPDGFVGVGPMAGGCLLHSSDTRFAQKFGDALRLHDRFESWAEHRMYSA